MSVADNYNSTKGLSIKKQTIWNCFSGFLAALEMTIMTATASRFVDLNAAGEITIAFALGYVFRTIGFWGVRNYHVSDRNEEYSFSVYRTARYFSMGVMIAFVLLYLAFAFFVQKRSVSKLLVIFLFQVVFAVESFEDVVWGEYQRKGRIDIGAKLFLVRWGSLIATFILSVFILRRLLPSIVISISVSLVFFFIFLLFVFGLPESKKGEYDYHQNVLQSKKLMMSTLPLFLITFLSFFLNNVAKYSLDCYYDASTQALFGFVTMPLFAVEMFSAFIYQPKLSNLSRLWLDKDIKEYIHEILRQLLYIIIILIVSIVLMYLLGIPILSFVFSTDLTSYRIDLIICALSGGSIAFLTYACAILTIMRKQKILLLQYGIATIIGGTFIWMLARSYGIRGATIGNLLVFSLQAVSLYVVMFLILKRNYCQLPCKKR